MSCNRDHHSVGGHVGYLVLGVQEGGEGDIPSSLLLGIKLLLLIGHVNLHLNH